jgi:biopolymer transport protein TolR
MAMKTGASDDMMSEINVTPMVDVMLVLLIIFMVAAPMMNTGVDVELPKVNAQKIDDPEGKLILSITKDKKLKLGAGPNATDVTWSDLEVKLKTNERLQREQLLWVEGDGDLPYSVVITAMAVAKNAGVEKVQLLTDATPDLKPRLMELDGAR